MIIFLIVVLLAAAIFGLWPIIGVLLLVLLSIGIIRVFAN